MSWSDCGKDSQGRPIGYAHAATCDHPGCNAEIDRGLSYACGGMHGNNEIGCEKYFCGDHLEYTVEHDDEFQSVCEGCMVVLTTSGDWALHAEDWVIRRIEAKS
jgi:hypothetical protein